MVHALLLTTAFCLGNADASAPAFDAPFVLQSAQERFHAGMQQRGDPTAARREFEQAAAAYQRLIDHGYHHPALYLNCGNAYLLADDLPHAILAYRGGLRRHPLGADLWDHLELAREQVAYPGGLACYRPAGDDWPPWLPRPIPSVVLTSDLVLYGLAWMTLTVWLVLRRRPVGFGALSLFAAALVAGGWWVYLEYRCATDARQPVVVVAVNGVALRGGNGPLYPRHPDLPLVNRGMEGRLLHERGGWVQVQFPGEAIGWLPRGAVLVEGS